MRVAHALRVVGTLLALVASTAVVHAQRDPRQRDAGYIGRTIPLLEIDDCRALDPALEAAQLRQRASEHYQRGETLYVQGDYDGAVTELVAAYCTVPYYRVLKDIGQAYERSLEYEKAIGYLERYVAAIPADATRESACAPDPQDDKANVARRIAVLQNLRSRVYVETNPRGAKITIGNDSGIAARAHAGDQIEILGGSYEMLVERDGYEPYTQRIEIAIGKPYTYYVQLQPLKGTLAVLVQPPGARVFLGDRFVGIGRYEEQLAAGAYRISVEAAGRVRVERTIEVVPNQIRREQLELAPLPQVGRRQLIVAASVGGALSTSGLLAAFDDPSITGAGFVLGGAAGLVGSYFLVPHDLPLGTSNLTITSGIVGAVGGLAGALVLTDRGEIVQPVMGAGLALGATAGYLVGRRTRIGTGDAALFNSSVVWGTAAGTLFAGVFDAPRSVASGLVLSGLGMGSVGGVLLARSFEISRTHAVLIDVGGIVGMISGLAIESLAHPSTTAADEAERPTERLAGYALGGMAVGLVGAGILTRNLDVPALPVQPTLGTSTGVGGRATTTYGISGTW